MGAMVKTDRTTATSTRKIERTPLPTCVKPQLVALVKAVPDGRAAFNLIQNASDTGLGSLVFFLFDLLFLDGENLMALPLVDRKARLEAFLVGAPESLRYKPSPDRPRPGLPPIGLRTRS
jgi:bifunctional non-homologous end joining protein LigD